MYETGSTIVVFRTPSQIVIGADSKLYKRRKPTRYLECKIHQVGSVFFTFVGVTRIYETGYSVRPIAIKAIEAGTTIRNRIEIFEKTIRPRLTSELVRIKKRYKRDYKENFANKPVLSIIFAGCENGIPILANRQFIPRTYGKTVRLHATRDYIDEGAHIFTMGYHAILNKYLTERNYDIKGELAEITHQLISLEFQANKHIVGPPIDILRSTKDRATWVKKKKKCPDIVPYW